MTIDISLDTLTGQVRAVIGDVTTPYEVSNNVIDHYLEQTSNNVTVTSIKCLQLLVAHYAKKVNQEVGDVRVWYSDRYKQYRQLLNDLQKNPAAMQRVPLPILGGTSKAEMQRVKDNCDTPYTGVSVGDFSKTTTVVRDGPFTLREA